MAYTAHTDESYLWKKTKQKKGDRKQGKGEL